MRGVVDGLMLLGSRCCGSSVLGSGAMHERLVSQSLDYSIFSYARSMSSHGELYALREKDQNFVAALLDAGLVDAEVIAKRLGIVPNKHLPATKRALGWLAART
jgi:hypothetical protein